MLDAINWSFLAGLAVGGVMVMLGRFLGGPRG